MAVLTGTYVLSPLQEDDNAYLSSGLSGFDVDYYPFYEYISSSPSVWDEPTWNAPVDAETYAITMVKARSFADDYYGHIHIRPNPLNLGAVSTTMYRDVEVWNAFLDRSELLSTIGEVNTVGVTLLDQPDPPTTFGILESRVYRVKVDGDGNPVIAAEFQFNFASEQPTLLVTGSRAIVMPYLHNWRNPVKDTLEGKTDIMIAKDGTEQRVQLRSRPRRYVEYLYTVQGNEKQRIKNDLWQAQARRTIIPLFIDPVELSESISAGATNIPVVTTQYRDFDTDESLAIITDGITSEVFEIDQDGGTFFIPKYPLALAWTKHTKVYPARLAALQDKQPVPTLTGTVSEFTVRYEILGDVGARGEAPYFDVYDGAAVSGYEPNWRAPVDPSFTRELRRLDSGLADPVIDDYHDQQSSVTKQLYTTHGRLSTRERMFWASIEGRWTNWEPTWESDITVIEEITEFDTILKVANAHHTSAYGPGHEDIRIQLWNGDVLYRGVTGIGEVGSVQENITIDSALGQTVQPGGIQRISYMQKVRANSDSIEMVWLTPEVMEVTVTYKGVPKEA